LPMSGIKVHESGGECDRTERLQRLSPNRLAAGAKTILLTTCGLIDDTSRRARIVLAREETARNRAAPCAVETVDWGGHR